MSRTLCFASLILIAAAPALAQQQKVGEPPEAMNMRLVGYSDLQERSAYQPTIHKQGDRYIAYIGHHGGTPDVPKPVNKMTGAAEFNGTSILDVTDPAHPKYLKHLPGLEGTYEEGGAQMVRVCDGKTLPKGDPNKFYLLRVFGGKAHEIWDVTDPANPALLARIDGLRDTHKNWWECDTGIAYLVSGAPGWRVKRMTMIYDLSDPAKPVKIRDFGLPGQEPGATGTIPTDVHGPISTGPQGNRVYFGYGTNKGGVLQIIDREKLLNGPKEPTPEKPKPSHNFDPNTIAKLIGQGKTPTAAPTQTPAATPQGLPHHDAPHMSMSMASALDAWLTESYLNCWTPPPGMPDGDTYVAQIKVVFNPDGSLSGRPVLLNPPSDRAWRAHAESAMRAVRKCDPLRVPAEYMPFFEQWKVETIHFDPRETQG